MDIDDVFEYIGILLLFINASIYIWGYRTLKGSVTLKYFTSYLIVTFLILITSFIFIIFFNNKNNLYLSHFYFLSQFILLSLFYKTMFNKRQKKWVNIVLISITLTIVIQYIIKPNLFLKFNTLEVFLTSFPLVIYSIVHLYNSLSDKRQYMYINAGILMYITTSTLIFILGDYLSNYSNKSISYIWFINKVLYVGYLLLILIEWKKNILPVKSK